MRNQQISTLALVLADLSDVGHINSTMSFVNVSGRNYVNVMVDNNNYTIDGDNVQVFAPPKQITFKRFLNGLMDITKDVEVQDVG